MTETEVIWFRNFDRPPSYRGPVFMRVDRDRYVSFWLDSIVSLQLCLSAVIINANIWMDLVRESYKKNN